MESHIVENYNYKKLIRWLQTQSGKYWVLLATFPSTMIKNNVLYQRIKTGADIRIGDLGQPNILVSLNDVMAKNQWHFTSDIIFTSHVENQAKIWH